MSGLNAVTMIGGLALFLYGMTLMGDGLSQTSGGRLEKILERLTSSPIRAVLLGAAVTGVIQSSSATTVMVVGFVNSGIMRLSQAVGIIMGANIGTTVTSWLLSLTGIEGENLFLTLCKPSTFSPILAIVAVFLLMFSKKDSRKNVSMIMMGFAILMFGMDTMTAAIEPLAKVPEFRNVLLMFQNPLFGMLAGLVVTAIIQSSSASVGILQALCLTGKVPMGTAIPIIMGQNIGTCITAILSSIGANRGARRAALVHLYFNLIGTTLFMVIFYSINAWVHFEFLSASAGVMDIAIVHSLFNISATAILLPFSKGLEKLAYLTLPESKQEKKEAKVTLLDERFLETPSYAIAQCKKVALDMMNESRQCFEMATGLVQNYDKEKCSQITSLKKSVHSQEEQLGDYLIRLSEKILSEKDSRRLSFLLHSITDYKRIADYSFDFAGVCKTISEKKSEFSKKALADIESLEKGVVEIANVSSHIFEQEDMVMSEKVIRMSVQFEELIPELKKRHIKRLRNGKCKIQSGFLWQDLLMNYKKIFEHYRNIALGIRGLNEENQDGGK